MPPGRQEVRTYLVLIATATLLVTWNLVASGEYQGATGYFFVSGHNDGKQITTRVSGEVCYP